MSFREAQYPKGINDEESPKRWPKRGLLYQNPGDSSPVQNDMVGSYSKRVVQNELGISSRTTNRQENTDFGIFYPRFCTSQTRVEALKAPPAPQRGEQWPKFPPLGG